MADLPLPAMILCPVVLDGKLYVSGWRAGLV
jgi:hypothetical protein